MALKIETGLRETSLCCKEKAAVDCTKITGTNAAELKANCEAEATCKVENNKCVAA